MTVLIFKYEDRNVDSSLLVLTVFMVNKKNLLLITFVVVLSESSLIFFFFVLMEALYQGLPFYRGWIYSVDVS